MRFARSSTVGRVVLVAGMAFGAFVGADSRAAETIRIEVEFFEDGDATPTNRATVWTSDRRVRIEQRGAGSAAPPPVFIYRGDRDLLLSVAEGQRSFVKIERRMLSLLGAGSPAARPAVDDQLAGLPQDQQRAFGHLLGGSQLDPKRPDDPLVVTREDETDTVAGFPCTRVSLSRSRRLLAQGCVASWDTVGLTPADVEVFRSLAQLTHDAMGSRLPIPIELVPGQPLDLVVQFGGFPLAFERAGRERGASAIRVASVERVASEDSLFEVPAGFSERVGMAGLAGFASLLRPSRGEAPSGPGPAAPAAPASLDPAALGPAGEEPGAIRSEASHSRGEADRRVRSPSAPKRVPSPYRSISLFGDPE